MRAYIIAALLLLLIFGSISGYLYNKFSTLAGMDFSPPPIAVATAKSSAERWDVRLAAVGTIRSTQGVELSTESSGEVIDITVSSGDKVAAGTALLRLNDKVERASKERQIANLDLAKILFKRDATLVEQKSIPQTQYDRSRADYESAVAQLAETEARLENKHVDAPFSGTVGIIHVKRGDYVAPGTKITTLQDLDNMEVDFTVPARHYPALRKGLGIELRAAAFPERVFHATLQAIDSRVDIDTRNLLLRASITDAEGLLPGMFAQLSIDLDTPVDVVTVPETAVTYALHGNTVFLVQDNEGASMATSKIVTTGESRKGRIAITSGLAAGVEVIISGQNKLYRGAAVTVTAAAPIGEQDSVRASQ